MKARKCNCNDELIKANKRIKELEEMVLSPEENDILYKYQNEGIEGNPEEMSRIIGKIQKFSIAKKPA